VHSTSGDYGRYRAPGRRLEDEHTNGQKSLSREHVASHLRRAKAARRRWGTRQAAVVALLNVEATERTALSYAHGIDASLRRVADFAGAPHLLRLADVGLGVSVVDFLACWRSSLYMS
jgi:hypothetical protein